MVQWSALTSYFQDTAFLSWSNLVLARPVGSAHIGSPEGGGLVIAFLIVTGLVGLSIYWGAKWKWSAWWRCALIFWTIWILLYSTFFTNLDGIGSGVWQSLGYWVVQQEVARGNQPWYYYFIVTSVYEFLPFIFAFVATAYFAKRGDPFGRFLIYWAVATFVLYTYASEKMPWLVVNITLPLIVLTGKMLGDIVERMPWRRAISNGGLLALPGVPLFIVLLWQLAFFEPGEVGAKDIVWLTLLVVGTIGVAALGVYLARAMGVRRFGGAAALSLAVMLAVLSVRTGAIANYKNADTPVELLVYTQTAPDIVSIVNRIREADQPAGERVSVPVSVDQTSGFTWPWAWYLRGRPGVDYPLFDNVSLQTPPDSSIVLVHLNNKAATDKALKDTFTDGERFKHRWWFPESAYRDITVRDFLASFRDRGAWRRAMDYFLHREGVRDRLGSEDAFAYFADELELSGAEP
jgi:predicted membrane-bound mannosyltransferase